jgi:hypothetical protein
MLSSIRFFSTLLVVVGLIVRNGAFDTGHHWDITNTALSLFGFSPRTIRNMQVMNWMVDFYSVSLVGKINDFQLLHCDTLRNTSEVLSIAFAFTKFCPFPIFSKYSFYTKQNISVSLLLESTFSKHEKWGGTND